jgi:hypothetical protein
MLLDAATSNIATLTTDGDVLTYTAISGMPWDRALKIGGINEYKEGQYVALRMKMTGSAYNYVYGAGNAVAFYDDNKQQTTLALGQWVTAVYRFTADTTVGVSSGVSGVFSLLDVPGSSMEISDVFVMNEQGYNAYFGQQG